MNSYSSPDHDADDNGNDGDADRDGLHVDRDGDDDNGRSHSQFDGDEAALLALGRPATAREHVAITSLIHRYYVAAAAGNGAESCTLTNPGLVHTIPQDESAPGYGPRFLSGLTTCAAIRSRLFAYTHSELTAPVLIAAIRVHGHKADVYLRSRVMPISVTQVIRTDGRWMIDRFVPGPLT